MKIGLENWNGNAYVEGIQLLIQTSLVSMTMHILGL
jgi:hypothetical protein